MLVEAHQAIMQSRFGQRQKSWPSAGQFAITNSISFMPPAL
jgi:hypothetical protein